VRRAGAGPGTGRWVETSSAVHDAARSSTLRRLAAVGLAGYGVVHLLVAGLVLQLAWRGGGPRSSDQESTADPTGALAVLAGSTAGRWLLALLAVGFAALTVWQAVEVLRHRRAVPQPGPERRAAVLQLLRTVGSALVYGWLTWLTVRAALAGGQQRDDEQRSARGVLALPGGQWLVVGAGVVLVVIGVYQLQKGWRAGFLDELDLDGLPPRLGRLTRVVCQGAFVAKGASFAAVGVVLGWAAATFDPDQATGLDGALQTIVATRYGPWVLTGIAAGFAAFSVYCFTRARHPVS
jgi:hypothetical protein